MSFFILVSSYSNVTNRVRSVPSDGGRARTLGYVAGKDSTVILTGHGVTGRTGEYRGSGQGNRAGGSKHAGILHQMRGGLDGATAIV